MKKIQKGFTLIELMIVVAIIGILAAVAIPAYQDYIVKAKLAKVVTSVDAVKLAYLSYSQDNGGFGVVPTLASLGLSAYPITNEISGIVDATTAGGAGGFTLTMQNIAATPLFNGTTVQFLTTPSTGSAVSTWVVTCSYASGGAPKAMLTKSFGC